MLTPLTVSDGVWYYIRAKKTMEAEKMNDLKLEYASQGEPGNYKNYVFKTRFGDYYMAMRAEGCVTFLGKEIFLKVMDTLTPVTEEDYNENAKEAEKLLVDIVSRKDMKRIKVIVVSSLYPNYQGDKDNLLFRI